jgi:hypothetical protein
MRVGSLPARALVGVALGLVIVQTACTPAPGPGTGGAPGTTSLAMPLAPYDQEALRAAEATMRRDNRDTGGLAALAKGAPELAGYMDRAASFLLVKAQAKMTARAGSPGYAAPLPDFPPPGAPIFGTYLMTTVVFNDLVAKQTSESKHPTTDSTEKCPCTKEATLDPTHDEVTVDGNKGIITTTISVKATLNASKISLDLKMKIEGEVRDATSGAVLYKVSSEASGHADGDVCPDASGVAKAQMSFSGKEDYFDKNGAKTGTGVTEGFGGRLEMKVNDDAKLAGVDVIATGAGGDLFMGIAARGAAPAFEQAWRSGMCIAVLVSPTSQDVDAGSETTVTVKVKHKVEGNELDKPVEAKLESGVKSIDPSGKKQKAPATFRFTAGSESGDSGSVAFDSISNRGIGHASATFTVAGGWTISAVGTSNEGFQGVVQNDLRVTIKDLKIKQGKDGALSGNGTMTLGGTVSTGAGLCVGNIDQSLPITASGQLVGTGPTAVLRLTLSTPAVPGAMVTMTCTLPTGGRVTQAVSAEGHSDRYGEALGSFDLPADGGTKTINKTAAIGGVMNVAAAGTFTVTKAKK